jgi:hypothetical protein
MHGFCVTLLGIGLGLLLPTWSAAATATAAQKIPTLAVIPTALPHDDYMLYERSRQRLEEEYAKFKLAAERFNAKATPDQTDAEFEALGAARQHVIAGRNDFNRTIDSRIDALSAAAGLKTFVFPQVSVRGDLRLVTGDGRILTAETIAGAHLDRRARVMTGPEARAAFVLPDTTAFTIGPNSEMVLDDFVYDPDTRASKVSARLAKGVFRWITGKVSPRDPSSLRVTTPVIAIITRGTDFSSEVRPDGSGEVRLYSGELELQDLKTGAKSVLPAGYSVTFADGKSAAPAKLPLEAERPVL